MTDESLSDHQKEVLRQSLVDNARKLLGIKYVYGAEWSDLTKLPEALDCSELVEGVFHQCGLRMPDGSQAQFDFTVPTGEPKNGDLGFFGRGANPGQVYHVGMVFDCKKNSVNEPFGQVIEARGFQPNSTFETGKVILRPIFNWMRYANFLGWRAHPKLS
jgi:hypothetical protein